ncbi:hypothetical protein LTR74_005184 [Friedmanniomyces endolithicus]|nr:hypothetical protein LTR74_005184 [Friedmanniomyces endolithicus]
MATAGVLSQGTSPETQTDSSSHATAAPTAEGSRPQIPPTRSMVALEDGAIAADEEAVDDLDESLLPMLYSRVGVDHDRTKAMFTRHGFAYEPRRRSSEEPAPKFRRVERPIRVRLHYRCHECQGQFAPDKSCTKCGHRRCADCVRQPGQRVMETMNHARQAKDREEEQQATPAAAIAAAKPDEPSPTHALVAVSGSSLEHDDQDDDDEVSLAQAYDLAIKVRPLGSERLVRDPSLQHVRWTCHECKTPFTSPTHTECEQCNHTRCEECPHLPPKANSRPSALLETGSTPQEEAGTVPDVLRVYRKARQRIRYTCDHCNAVFADKYTCQTCGHGRCKGCSRNP